MTAALAGVLSRDPPRRAGDPPGRAAHETTLASFEGRPGTRHLYGEVFCEAIEQSQRDALDKPRPELVVKVDRSGLNEHHPIVERLYGATDRLLVPIVAGKGARATRSDYAR